MLIISRLSSLGITEEAIEELENGEVESAIAEVFSGLSSAFDEETTCADTYLYESYDPERYLFGAVEPERLIERIKVWNTGIKAEFLAAIDDLCNISNTGELPEIADLPVDTNKTYRVSLAARELDDHWHAFSDHAVYMESHGSLYPYFHVLLTDKEVAEIVAHPFDYLIADIYVKS